VQDDSSDEITLEFTGERFVPGTGGSEIALEHEHRYAAAASLARGKDVVDLGCGSGYGASLLSGSRSYRGYDIAADAVAFAAARFGGPTVTFTMGDAAGVDADSASADMVVCFEVLEHVHEPATILREAKRLLRPEGLFISSTPDRTAYNQTRPEPNPFHFAEMERDEYRRLLSDRFEHVQLYGQAYLQASWILDESSSATVTLLRQRLGHPAPEATPIYWVALASDAPLPRLIPSVLMGGDEGRHELIRVVAQLREYERELEARRGALEAADARELNARAQLASYEQTIRDLRARLGADAS
jgi:SAM-dependent methyltransferase